MEKDNNSLSPQGSEVQDVNGVRFLLPDDIFAEKDEPAPQQESEQDAGEPSEESPSMLLPPEVEMLPDSLNEELPPIDDEDELYSEEEYNEILNHQKKHSIAPSFDPVQELAEAEEIPDSAPEKNGEPKERKIDFCFDMLEMFVFALAFVILAMAFCFRHSVVDGGSMDQTLYDGEHLIISDLFYTPKTGDIVVVQDTSKQDTYPSLSKPIVKRVIATENQEVVITSDGRVYVDGVLLDEPYVYIDTYDYTYDTLKMTVPEGYVFLMGDHRNVSLDSRSPAGPFSEDAILGKVVLRFLPIDRFGTVN